MDSTFATAISALRFVPEEMRSRAIALADILSASDGAELLKEMRKSDVELKQNVGEQGKILDDMDVIVTGMEKGLARVERGDAEAKEQSQDVRHADELLTNES
ncbi:MAG: hypothetical protein WCS85_03745 [Candidatus Peribacteraceae bacterium]